MIPTRSSPARRSGFRDSRRRRRRSCSGALQSDHRRTLADGALGTLTEFRTGLERFSRTYAYIAQLIELSDPDLENFSSFVKLLSSRLDGVTPDEIDLKGLALTGFEIKPRDSSTGGNPAQPTEEDLILSMTSNNALAKLLLKGDEQALGILTDIIYDFLRSGEQLDISAAADA
ncbi:hypothetical protein FSB78_15160 [Sphingomonas ginsenosidivorax]|uniref:Uncharacterized protein n=1 Tax=Sphingomonas ginsenosidivorax TaxID=862135 RepID=A0A5C6UIE2_9SPHN|nr:hypothetical protein [Sphingomonas ginsenosidivorax]TXC72134.1 hypothetical protein FSB78_15160 [Sphingomonas ginsenosidivorax]